MKTIVVLFIALIALGIVYIFLKKYEKFEEQVTVTFFYMNGCGWCEKFKPEWEKFKKVAGPNVIVKEVEAEQMTAEQQNKIRGFPTLILSKGGKDVEYDGDRTAKDLLAHLKRDFA
jgi:thiol-disulfide isomerase/thioredoxin